MRIVALALLTAVVTPLAGCAPSWSNWAGNVRCRPQMIVRPRDEAELQRAVRAARHLRVVAAGHSWSALDCDDDTLIDVQSLTRVLSIDDDKRLVRVETGIKLGALDDAVAAHHLALATEPSIAEITAGGAISTASHGTGLAHGAFSEEVVALELFDANGDKHVIDDADELRAARVGLGALGVIYAITFRLVPAFNLEIHEQVLDDKALFDDLDRVVSQDEHVDLFWFLTEHKVFLRTYNRSDAPIHVSHPARDWIEEWVVRTWVAEVGLAAASKIPGLSKLINREQPKIFPTQTDVDRSDHIFHRFPGHQTVYSMEYLVPIERTRDALQAIRAALDATGFYPNMPPYLRFVGGAGDGDLSPMRGHKSCAIEVLSYVGFKGWERFFRDLEPRFLALGGRPHWGKMFFASPRDRYSRADWEHVERLRKKLDPRGKMLNPLTRALFEAR